MSGSEIYRLSPDGSPRRLWSSKEDLVYAWPSTVRAGCWRARAIAARLYLIGKDQFVRPGQGQRQPGDGFRAYPKGGLYAATSNLGKIFQLGPNAVSEGTYESDVFDAKNFSHWGRVEVRGNGSFQLFARSGNVDNPDRNWSPWKPVDLQRNLPIDAPPARFIQWKAVLKPGAQMPEIDASP